MDTISASRSSYSNAAPVLLVVAATGAVVIPCKVYTGPISEVVTAITIPAPMLRSDRLPTHFLTDLDSAKYALKGPIAVSLEMNDDEYVMSIPEAGISTSGDTATEALRWLKDSIVSTYEVLRSNKTSLGPLPKQQLQALEAYVVKKQARKA